MPQIPGRQCPCGKPAAVRLWEAPGVHLCLEHARRWLGSEAKKEIVALLESEPEAKTALDIPRAHAALLAFVAEVERDGGRWRRFKRWLARRILS